MMKIGIVNSQMCSCDNISVTDLNHDFFTCRNHSDAISEFTSFLNNINIQFPINVTTLLYSNNKQVFDRLVKSFSAKLKLEFKLFQKLSKIVLWLMEIVNAKSHSHTHTTKILWRVK